MASGELKPHADNVFLVFEQEATVTAGGLHIPGNAKRGESRWARIVAVGPGHHNRLGVFIPTEVKEGQRALVDKLAGQNYDWDLTVPRTNKKGCEWQDDGLEWRAVREAEIMAVEDAAP